ncbi:uncharacterized protein LOC120183083 [Hibiscus syriacus]|uniref:uncharacterized protein LOC120183083 n=1 Tax=Hibiscus syriacus TaxID=106335 RepID=UPI0019233E3F|nr:uncharacterized protein LOC120183083 [Hibiscus syriacus]
MKTMLANVWHSIRGISITELDEGLFLFWLYHEVDVNQIEREGPWFFNSHMLLLHRLHRGEDPMGVELQLVDVLVLANDLSMGFISEQVAKLLGNFMGLFLEYNAIVVSLGYRSNLRFRVRIDIRKLLKRKKLALPSGKFSCASFRYEKLKMFYFMCCKLSHGEGFYLLCILRESKDLTVQWDASLKALPRR